MHVTRRRLAAAGAALLLAHRARAAEPAEPLTLAQIVELTGAAATAGDAFRSGVELAVQEINAAGGLAGKLVQVITFDAQSSNAGGRGAMQKALELDPLAVLGPALAEPARGALSVPRPHGTPLIVGANAADLTGAAHPATFRALPSATAMMARLVAWLRDEPKPARPAVLWSGHEPFRESRDALVHEARAHGLDVAADWVSELTDPAADLARLLRANPDLLIVLVPPENAGHVIAEARRQAPRLPLLGEAALVAPRALEAAGAAAEGVRAHVLLPPTGETGPAADFVARYTAADKQAPDEFSLAGYVAVGMLKTALEKAAMVDARALADALRGLSATAARQPMLTADTTWNTAGDPDRASFVVEVRGGSCRGIKTLRDAA